MSFQGSEQALPNLPIHSQWTQNGLVEAATPKKKDIGTFAEKLLSSDKASQLEGLIGMRKLLSLKHNRKNILSFKLFIFFSSNLIF